LNKYRNELRNKFHWPNRPQVFDPAPVTQAGTMIAPTILLKLAMTEPLDSRQLRAFVTLAETGSFTLAAKKLFLSQSAVSHSIRALEEDTGCRLLDRVGKKAALTQAGEQLLHHANKVLQQMAEARNALEHLGKWGRSRLRLGASSTACEHILPPVLRTFQEKHPQCSILLEPGDTPQVLEMLHSNRIDIGLALEPKGNNHFEFHPLFSDELFFLLAPSHPWVVVGHVIRREIPGQNYILYSKSSYTFQLVQDYFRREEMGLNTVIELGNMNAIKELVKLGLGISIAAPWIARNELQEGSLHLLPLGSRKVKRHWGVVHRRGRRLNLAEETFIRICRSLNG
jgi:LysR family transcriptional regulator, low CO2-responsive transcriptional regulator